MDRQAFDGSSANWPPRSGGDVVIRDNLSVHKSAKAANALADRGAWFLFLPQYALDLTQPEMAFSKLKAHLRKAAARTFEALWTVLGNICAMFQPE